MCWKGSALAGAALGQLNSVTDQRVLFHSIHLYVFSPLQYFSCSVMRTHPRWEQNGQQVTKHFWCRKKSRSGTQNIPGEDDAVAQPEAASLPQMRGDTPFQGRVRVCHK